MLTVMRKLKILINISINNNLLKIKWKMIVCTVNKTYILHFSFHKSVCFKIFFLTSSSLKISKDNLILKGIRKFLICFPNLCEKYQNETYCEKYKDNPSKGELG